MGKMYIWVMELEFLCWACVRVGLDVSEPFPVNVELGLGFVMYITQYVLFFSGCCFGVVVYVYGSCGARN